MNLFKKILMIVGTLVLIFFVFIDYFGIGDPGLGPRQLIGAAAGILIVIIGLALKRKKPA